MGKRQERIRRGKLDAAGFALRGLGSAVRVGSRVRAGVSSARGNRGRALAWRASGLAAGAVLTSAGGLAHGAARVHRGVTGARDTAIGLANSARTATRNFARRTQAQIAAARRNIEKARRARRRG
jgi:hypothetical protein